MSIEGDDKFLYIQMMPHFFKNNIVQILLSLSFIKFQCYCK